MCHCCHREYQDEKKTFRFTVLCQILYHHDDCCENMIEVDRNAQCCISNSRYKSYCKSTNSRWPDLPLPCERISTTATSPSDLLSSTMPTVRSQQHNTLSGNAFRLLVL